MSITPSIRCTIAGLAFGLAAITNPLVRGERLLAAASDKSIKLSGCLVKGDTGYLLTNAPADPSLGVSDTRLAPSEVGTTGAFTTVFYWLNEDGALKPHVGHRVEIEGDLKGQLREGEIKLDRQDRWTELTVKADGRTMKANVPNASVVPLPGQRKDKKEGEVIVRRIDVEHVKMLGANCAE